MINPISKLKAITTEDDRAMLLAGLSIGAGLGIFVATVAYAAAGKPRHIVGLDRLPNGDLLLEMSKGNGILIPGPKS